MCKTHFGQCTLEFSLRRILNYSPGFVSHLWISSLKYKETDWACITNNHLKFQISEIQCSASIVPLLFLYRE